MNDKENNLLSEIKKQIERFDTKASILSAISSVLLGMSLDWVSVFKNLEYASVTTGTYFLIVFVILYIICLCVAIITFIWSILPRSKPKKIKKIATSNHSLYYKDLQNMDVNNIKAEILQNDENNLLQQIKINSIIASKKHKFLVYGIIFLILSIILIIISILIYTFS